MGINLDPGEEGTKAFLPETSKKEETFVGLRTTAEIFFQRAFFDFAAVV